MGEETYPQSYLNRDISQNIDHRLEEEEEEPEEDTKEKDNIVKKQQAKKIATTGIKRQQLAPRSNLQFKVGPAFLRHKQFHHIVTSSDGTPIDINLEARIDRGFDLIGDQWVGYKRNYFTLVAAFQTSSTEITTFLEESYTLDLKNPNILRSFKILQFGIDVMAKLHETNVEIGLVQHTTKRDKGPHGKPKMVPLVPSNLPDHESVRAITNMKRARKGSSLENAFYYHYPDEISSERPFNSADQLINGYPSKQINKVARFERLQFGTSSGIRNKNGNCKMFQLDIIIGVVIKAPQELHLEELPSVDLVEMSNNGNNTYFVHLIERSTPSLVIRGRSPANYTEDGEPIQSIRRESTREQMKKPISVRGQKPERISDGKAKVLQNKSDNRKVNTSYKELTEAAHNQLKSGSLKPTVNHLPLSLREQARKSPESQISHYPSKRQRTGAVKYQLGKTPAKLQRKITVKCSFQDHKPHSHGDILKCADVNDSIDHSLSKINFLEESSPLKQTTSPSAPHNFNVFRSTPQFNRTHMTSKDNNDSTLITTFNTSSYPPASTLSSPLKLRPPNKMPSFMNKKEREGSYPGAKKLKRSRYIQTLEELEKEVLEKRQILMGNIDSKSPFKLVVSPDKNSLKSVNFKDIETKGWSKSRPENIVLLGSVLYSNSQSVYHNSRYNQYQNYVEDTSPKFNRSYIRRDVDSASSELNTNELSATNLTFSHLYDERSKGLLNRNQIGKSDPTQFTSEDNILNYIMEEKEKVANYTYLAEPTTDDISDKEPRANLELLSSASDSMLLSGLQSSEGMTNGSKHEEFINLKV